jgi:hypothetical protein
VYRISTNNAKDKDSLRLGREESTGGVLEVKCYKTLQDWEEESGVSGGHKKYSKEEKGLGPLWNSEPAEISGGRVKFFMQSTRRCLGRGQAILAEA